MQKRTKNFKTFLVLLCLLTICCSGCGRWKGGSLSDWEAALEDSDPQKRAEAAIALGSMGADGVPGLTKALADESTMVRRKAAQALGGCGPEAASAVEPLTKLLQDQALEIQEASAMTLGMIGPAAKEALPALQQAYKRATQQREAGLAQTIGEAIRLINNQDPA